MLVALEGPLPRHPANMVDITQGKVIANPDTTISPRRRATTSLERMVPGLLANPRMRPAGQVLPSLGLRSQDMDSRMVDTEHHRRNLRDLDSTLLRLDSHLTASHRGTSTVEGWDRCDL